MSRNIFLLHITFAFFVTVALTTGVYLARAQQETENVGISIEIPCTGQGCPAEQVPEPGPGAADTRAGLMVEGFAPPGALLFILQNGAVARTAGVPLSGVFSESISGLSPGPVKIGVFATDIHNHATPTVSVDIVLFAAQTTRIFNFLLPPTIAINGTRPDVFGTSQEVAVRQGERIIVSGYTFPFTRVRVIRFPDRVTQEVVADIQGAWEALYATNSLTGGYSVSARSSLSSGLLSEDSSSATFVVIPLPGREPLPPRESGEPPPISSERPQGPIPSYIDVNNDHLVNLFDFSILLYNWGVPKTSYGDFNGDGVVDLIDISILFYWWTG